MPCQKNKKNKQTPEQDSQHPFGPVGKGFLQEPHTETVLQQRVQRAHDKKESDTLPPEGLSFVLPAQGREVEVQLPKVPLLNLDLEITHSNRDFVTGTDSTRTLPQKVEHTKDTKPWQRNMHTGE